MPFISIKTNKNINKEAELAIKDNLGELISLVPGKSEDRLMIEFNNNKEMFFAGSNDDLVMVEVKIYGNPISSETLNPFTASTTKLISKTLNIPSKRIYISYFFTNSWGYDGENF